MMQTIYCHKIAGQNGAYRVREINPQEKDAFNGFVQGTRLGTFYQSYEWGELKRRSGWTPLRLVLEQQDGGITGAATILKRKAAGMTMFYSPRGPMLDYEQPELLRLFCQGVTPLARQAGAAFWRMDPELTGPHYAGVFTRAGLRAAPLQKPFGGIQPRWVWRVRLTGNPEAQWSALKKGGRRQVNRARRAGVTIRDGSAPELPVFYRLLQDTADRDGFKIRHQSYFENLWRQLHPAHRVKLSFACHRDEPVSTALVIGFGQGVWDIYAGNSKSDRNLSASYLLAWELIEWACREGYSFYDLGGIVPQAAEKDPLAGLRFFKSRFGGQDVEFAGEFDLVFNPVTYRIWNWGQQGIRLLRRYEAARRLKSKAGFKSKYTDSPGEG